MFFFLFHVATQGLTALRVKRYLSGLSVECVVLVRQTKKDAWEPCVREREAGGETSPL